jgi:hypothetical protein
MRNFDYANLQGSIDLDLDRNVASRAAEVGSQNFRAVPFHVPIHEPSHLARDRSREWHKIAIGFFRIAHESVIGIA